MLRSCASFVQPRHPLRTIFLLALAACEFHASTSTPAGPAGVDGGVVVPGDARPLDGSVATLCTGYAALGALPGPSLYLVVNTPVRFKSAEQNCEASQG